MKKGKIIVLILAIALVVGTMLAVTLPAAAAINEEDWIAAPKNTLIKCPGGACDHTSCDYVYSFAVIGDTQNLNYTDAKNYVAALAEDPTLTYEKYTSAYMRTLYNWILANKASKNIEYVLGLGDITQSFNTSQTYYDEEWPLAKEAIKLLDGEIGYSLVRGNHDISSGMNGVFGIGTEYYNALAKLAEEKDEIGRPMAGFLNPEKVEDTYRKIVTSSGDKYIIFTLDYYPTEACVDWLNDILAANSDYTAIITLHAFLNTDRTFIDDFETTTPADSAADSSWYQIATGGNVSPRTLWDNALSKHANVKFIFSGHVTGYALNNQLIGENGNTVSCFLVDAQGLDNSAPIGMITMVYVSADGSVVNVENFSPVRLAEGKNAYFKDENQFELTVDYGEDWTSTKYGDIPSYIYNNTDYAFHVFIDDNANTDDTNFYWGSYATWAETLSALHEWNGIGGAAARAKKTYNIIMMNDYTHSSGIAPNASGGFPGKFNLDLNGKTLTICENGVMIPYYATTSYTTPAFTVQNGNVIMSGDSSSRLAVLQGGKKNGGVYTLNFEKLDITYTSDSASPLVGMYKGYEGYKSNINLNITDCKIDTSGSGGAVTLFNLKDTYNNNDTKLILKGGSIIGTTAANIIYASLNEDSDSIFYAVGSDGKYTTLTLSDNTAELSGLYRNTDGSLLQYTDPTETDGAYLYEMEIAPVEETPYGYIFTDDYPLEAYPFVLFRDGEVIAAYDCYYAFLKNASIVTAESTLFLRADYTTGTTADAAFKSASSNVDRYIYNITAPLTIDLNQKTLSRGSNHLFQTMFYGKSYEVTIKNGTLNAANNTIHAINDTGTKAKGYGSFVFDTVKFTTGAVQYPFVDTYAGGTGADIDITYNNCTFDITGNTKSGIVLFDMKDSSDKFDINITFNGGKLIADETSIKNTTFATFNEENDSIKLGTHNGNEFVLELPSSVAHPQKFVVVDGETLYFTEIADDGSIATYKLLSNATDYGTVSLENLSLVNYPFALFKNGEMIHAFSNWIAFIENDVVENTEYRTGCELVLRRDYTTGSSSSQNLCYISDLIIDLCGNRFVRGEGHIFQAYGKMSSSTGSETEIIVKNGIMLTSAGNAPIAFNNSSSVGASAKFDFVFDSVIFGRASGSTAKLVAESFTSGAYGSNDTITLNNCVISLIDDHISGSVAPAANAYLFDLEDGGKNNISVTINGGEVRLENSSYFKIATVDSAGDSVTFSKYSENNYTKFIVPSGADAPTVSINSGVLTFVKVSDDGTEASYTLMPTATVDLEFKPKMSITLGSELVYNVYVPVVDYLKSFTIDGNTVECKEIFTLDDGNSYYRIEVSLPAKEAARNIILKATVTVDGKDYTGSWTVSIPKYAAALLETNVSEEEKTLVKDVLQYIRAAYAYFGTEDAEQMAKIGTLLGDYASKPTVEGSDVADTTGMKSATLVLSGKPSIRFYLAEDANASAYKFYIGGKEVNTIVSEDGAYVDIDVYAYALCETVTYTVDDAAAGSFHINAYYAYVSGTGESSYAGEDKESLTALIECFWKYLQSARTYRNSVVES